MSASRTFRRLMKLAIPSFIMLLFYASPGAAQGISGEWTGKMEGKEGSFDIFFTFAVKSDTLAGTDTLVGTVSGPMGNLPICNGRVEGDQFAFDAVFGRSTIHHWCTLTADSISMHYVGFEGKNREIILRHVADVKE